MHPSNSHPFSQDSRFPLHETTAANQYDVMHDAARMECFRRREAEDLRPDPRFRHVTRGAMPPSYYCSTDPMRQEEAMYQERLTRQYQAQAEAEAMYQDRLTRRAKAEAEAMYPDRLTRQCQAKAEVEVMYQDRLTRQAQAEAEAEAIRQDRLTRQAKAEAEAMYQDRLIHQAQAEAMRQDRLFLQAQAEAMCQDRLFRQVQAEAMHQDRLFRQAQAEAEAMRQDRLFLQAEAEAMSFDDVRSYDDEKSNHENQQTKIELRGSSDLPKSPALRANPSAASFAPATKSSCSKSDDGSKKLRKVLDATGTVGTASPADEAAGKVQHKTANEAKSCDDANDADEYIQVQSRKKTSSAARAASVASVTAVKDAQAEYTVVEGRKPKSSSTARVGSGSSVVTEKTKKAEEAAERLRISRKLAEEAIAANNPRCAVKVVSTATVKKSQMIVKATREIEVIVAREKKWPLDNTVAGIENRLFHPRANPFEVSKDREENLQGFVNTVLANPKKRIELVPTINYTEEDLAEIERARGLAEIWWDYNFAKSQDPNVSLGSFVGWKLTVDKSSWLAAKMP